MKDIESEKIHINLKNCFGINKLDHTFEFSSNSRVVAIYASNGTMKTSFAKTFQKLHENKIEEIKDEIFKKPTKINITIGKKSVDNKRWKVVRAEDAYYVPGLNQDNIAKLVVDKDLKDEYSKLNEKINQTKKEFLDKLKQDLSIEGDIEGKIVSDFKSKNPLQDLGIDLITILNKNIDVLEKAEVEHIDINEFTDIDYNFLFKEKYINFLNSADTQEILEEYIRGYKQSFENLTYLTKDFSFSNIDEVTTKLKTQNFFKAGHQIILRSKNEQKGLCIEDLKSLEKIIKKEKEKIFTELRSTDNYKKLHKSMDRSDLQELRTYLEENQNIIRELKDMDNFAKKIWLAYFTHHKVDWRTIIDEYTSAQKKIKELVSRAQKTETEWKKVINIFKRRFCVPFKLELENKDAIFGVKAPMIKLTYENKEKDNPIEISERDAENWLSEGELRALRILYLVYTLEIESTDKTILILDDIVDTLDYQNKYAVIQYLLGFSKKYNQIILTHNFDFFRTIEDRGLVDYEKCFLAHKTTDQIRIKKFKGIKNIIVNDWFDNLSSGKEKHREKLIASIPAIRNLIEYTQGIENEDYKKLSSLTHYRDDTDKIMIKDLKDIFIRVIGNRAEGIEDTQETVLKQIYEINKKFLDVNIINSYNFELVDKINLSIVIRITAEKIMRQKIDLSNKNLKLGDLFEKYEKLNEESSFITDEDLGILERAVLMTPSNIHLNAFMYEPIVDLDPSHLVKLYVDINELDGKQSDNLNEELNRKGESLKKKFEHDSRHVQTTLM